MDNLYHILASHTHLQKTKIIPDEQIWSLESSADYSIMMNIKSQQNHIKNTVIF